MSGTGRKKSFILTSTAVLGLLFLFMAVGIIGDFDAAYAEAEVVEEMELGDDTPGGVGEIITLDKIPNHGGSSTKRDGLSMQSLPAYIPTLAVVIGFNGMSYTQGLNWNTYLFTHSWGLREYYRQMSFGQFTFEPVNETCSSSDSDNTNINDSINDGVIHVKLDQNHYDWGAWDDYTTTRWMARAFIQAIEKASNYIDFTSYDKNGNGELDKNEFALVFIVAGYESGGDDSDTYASKRMRSHHWSISGILKKHNITTGLSVPVVTKDGKSVKVDHYAAVCEEIKKKNNSGNLIAYRNSIGTVAHELGHHLGLPDLYDLSEAAESDKKWSKYDVYRSSLMSSGNWTKDLNGNYRPSSLDPWCKVELGWLTTSTISATGEYTVSAADYTSSPIKKPVVRRININSKEYYLVECRRAEGWDEGLQTAYDMRTKDKKGGIIFWHVDQQVLDLCVDSTVDGKNHYYRINNSDHRPSVMPLFIEQDKNGNRTLIGEGGQDPDGKSKVFTAMPFFDLTMFNGYRKYLGADLNLPTYGSRPWEYAPITRNPSGIHVEPLSDSASSMNIRLISASHTHSWTYSTEPASDYCTSGKYTTVQYCSGCGQTVRTEFTEAWPSHRKPLIHFLRTEPKCLTAGRKSFYKCSLCQKKFSDSDANYPVTDSELYIAPLGHDWYVDEIFVAPTYDDEGENYEVCSRCGEGRWVSTPRLDRTKKKGTDGTPLGEDAAIEAADKFLVKYSSEKDPAGSKYSKLLARSTKQGKTSITIKWKSPADATYFVIYGSKCGKTNKLKKIKEVYYGHSSVTIKKISGKKLKKGTYYKFVVVAVDMDDNVVSTSKQIHVATKGTKKRSNNTSVYVSKKVVKKAAKLKKGKTLALKAKAKKKSGCKVAKHVGLRYETTKKSVAKVTSKGTIKAVGKGTCYVYAYAQNGVYKKIKVVVK